MTDDTADAATVVLSPPAEFAAAANAGPELHAAADADRETLAAAQYGRRLSPLPEASRTSSIG
jgi:hypothetical protein